MSKDHLSENEVIQAPPRLLMVYIVVSAILSVTLLLLSFWCPLNVDKVQINSGQGPNHRQIFFLTTFIMFVAGMAGGCLSNIRRIIQHSAPGPFDLIYCLSYYLRPLLGGIAGIVVFFLLLGGTLTFNVGNTGGSIKAWMTLSGRAPYIAFALLAGYGSKEFTNKLTDLADSLFALSRNKK